MPVVISPEEEEEILQELVSMFAPGEAVCTTEMQIEFNSLLVRVELQTEPTQIAIDRALSTIKQVVDRRLPAGAVGTTTWIGVVKAGGKVVDSILQGD